MYLNRRIDLCSLVLLFESGLSLRSAQARPWNSRDIDNQYPRLGLPSVQINEKKMTMCIEGFTR